MQYFMSQMYIHYHIKVYAPFEFHCYLIISDSLIATFVMVPSMRYYSSCVLQSGTIEYPLHGEKKDYLHI